MAVEVTSLNEVLLGMVGSVVALFGWLLKRVMEENAKREEGYRQTITENQKVMLAQQTTIAELAEKYEGLREAITELADRMPGGNAA